MKPAIDSASILGAFTNIEQALTHLSQHIQKALADLPLWIYEDGGFSTNRTAAIEAINKFTPTPGLSPKETFQCPGVIAGTTETLKLIQAVNTAKDAFLAVIKQYRQKTHANPTKAIRDILLKHSCGTIKLKMLCRHIKYIPHHPHKISWGLGKHSTNITLSVSALSERLHSSGTGEHIDIQLAKLATLKTGALIRHVETKPLWVANFCLKREGEADKRGLLRTSLPIFYLHDPSQAVPSVVLATQKERKALHRSDKQLEDEPFLPSVKAYRKKTVP